MDRRAFLRRTGAAATLPSLAPAAPRREPESSGPAPARDGAPADPSPATTLLPGTEHETPVYVNEGDTEGPTALVVGGVHGDEPPGYLAAGRLATRTPESGTLVVLPRANRVAIERDAREGEGGDLNRQFPTGAPPETELASAIWELVVRRDPDVVVDLHRSVGIYGRHHDSVGQAVFPGAAGDAPSVAASVVDRLDEEAVPWYMPLHDFRRGNFLDGSRPMLVHKVVGDLGRPGYIVETTRFLVDTATQARWLALAATALCARHGVELTDGEPSDGGGP